MAPWEHGVPLWHGCGHDCDGGEDFLNGVCRILPKWRSFSNLTPEFSGCGSCDKGAGGRWMIVVPQIIWIWLHLWFGHFGLRSPISVPSAPSVTRDSPRRLSFYDQCGSLLVISRRSWVRSISWRLTKHQQEQTISIDSKTTTTRHCCKVMALIQRQSGSVLSRVLFGSPSIHTTTQPSLPLLTSITLPSISISIPGFLSEIWEGILKAVPKKKTSHMKKRHRQLAGKALKDVKAVCSCPGCGRPKKAHFLCPYCVAGKLYLSDWELLLMGRAEIKQSYMDRRLDGTSSSSTTQQNAWKRLSMSNWNASGPIFSMLLWASLRALQSRCALSGQTAIRHGHFDKMGE